VTVAPGLTLRAIAVLSGAVALPFATSSGAAFATSSESAQDPTAGVAGPNLVLGIPPGDVSHGEPQGDLHATAPDGDASHNRNQKIADGGEPNASLGISQGVTRENPEVGCLSRTICAIKEKIRWQTPAWTQAQCSKIASAVLTSSVRYQISSSLLLAVMINESDLNEKAARVTVRENKVYAKDSGLMAIRCVLGKRDRCLNGNVRGLAWTDVMEPAKNVDLGARELAYWKNGGAATRTIVKVRDATGRIRPIFRTVPCRHTDHAYWAHYNHGPHYISHGYPRHYPHRVAVLDHALAAVLNVDAPELNVTRVTMHDPGKRQRTADRPLEARYKKLCTQIQSVGTCSAVALN